MSDGPTAQTQAGGYEGRIGRYASALADAFVARAGVRRGQRVLDVGCGTGALVAACVWDFAGGMTVMRTFWDAAAEVDAGAARFDQSRDEVRRRLRERLGDPVGAFRLGARAWNVAGLSGR